MSIQSAVTREASAPPHMSIAAYLSLYFTTVGFATSRLPETEPIAAACDLVLSRRTNQGAVDILCIVDRERRQNAQFAYPLDALVAIGNQCLKYADPRLRHQSAVRIHVIEIGPGINSPHLRDHLGAYGMFGGEGVLIRAWAIDLTSNKVWTNADPIDRFVPLETIEHEMRLPHRSEADLARAAEAWRVAQASGKSRVWLTYALIAVLAVVYGCEIAIAQTKSFSLSAADLAAAGGLSRNFVDYGQWFRVLTAPFLHANPIHLGMNALVLFFAGRLLERTIGTMWFAVAYLVAALGGAFGSMLINPPYVVTVGASGALMGVVAALGICSYHFPCEPLGSRMRTLTFYALAPFPYGLRSRMRNLALYVLIPSLAPMIRPAPLGGSHIDYAAHVGGALAGVLVGAAILQVWSPTDLLPRYRWLATTIAAIGLAALAFTPLAVHRSIALIPEADVPITDVGQHYQGPKLAAKYPHDPRARLFHAYALIDKGDVDGAERELRGGLADIDNLPYALKHGVEMALRANLALVLSQRGNTQDAKGIAASVCRSDPQDIVPLRQALADRSLCD
jgi:rhomboid protease GluP